MRSFLSALLLALALPAYSQGMPEGDLALERLFDQYREFCMSSYPEWATYEGDYRFNDRLTDISAAAIRARLDSAKSYRERALAVPDSVVSPQYKAHRDLFVWSLDDEIVDAGFEDWVNPISQQNGLHLDFPQLVDATPFRTPTDYDHYVSRLKAFRGQMVELLVNMRLGIERKVTQPRFVYEIVMKQAEEILDMDLDESPFYVPVLRDTSLRGEEREATERRVRRAIEQHVLPAYEDLIAFLRSEMIPVAREEDGIWAMPDGDKRYAAALRHYTTLKLSPEQVFKTGMEEVERLHKLMDEVRVQVGYEGTLEEFHQHLRDEDEFYYEEEDSLVEGFRAILRRVDKELPSLFGRLPKTPYELKVIEAYRAPSAAAAYYQSAPEDGSRPGYFQVNTYGLDQRPRFSMTALALHEAVPGHHLQIALAQEQTRLPWFRRKMGVTAFVEGWALYAESLGYEMGLYDDPYQRFGQLDFEMWRACRLVVDAGIHAKKWTREQAVEFLMRNSANSELDTRSEVDRYIAWPGQATAYKTGQLKFAELRQKARALTGARFSLKGFHDQVLAGGAVPLPYLERAVFEWIGRNR